MVCWWIRDSFFFFFFLVESKDFGTLPAPIVVFVLSETDPTMDEVSLG